MCSSLNYTLYVLAPDIIKACIVLDYNATATYKPSDSAQFDGISKHISKGILGGHIDDKDIYGVLDGE